MTIAAHKYWTTTKDNSLTVKGVGIVYLLRLSSFLAVVYKRFQEHVLTKFFIILNNCLQSSKNDILVDDFNMDMLETMYEFA